MADFRSSLFFRWQLQSDGFCRCVAFEEFTRLKMSDEELLDALAQFGPICASPV